MLYKATTALYRILALKKRLKIIQGGSSAGKTIGILLILIERAQLEQGKIFSVVSESLPHLKRGVIRNFLHILTQHKYYNENNWNQTDYIYTFPETGSIIEFFSAKDSDKVHGPRRDVLFINECNNVPFDTYTQLVIRTNEDVYLDFNPISQFWVHEEIIPKFEHDFLILTYKDNEGLSPAIINEIESRKEIKNFWKVYGLGELGELVGQIYNNWRVIDEIPFEARLERLWVDYGYTNDPTSIGALYYYNGGYILDELAYQKRMSNKDIADVLANQEPVVVAADGAEPKSNDELSKTYGLTIVAAPKGKGSVNQGIQLVQKQKISVTSRSVNIIKEYRNYAWDTNEWGKTINTPITIWNHAMDGIRYAFQTIDPNSFISEEQENAERLMSRLKNTAPKTR